MKRFASLGWSPTLRWRVRFSRGDEVKYVPHLSLMRFWERALRRASLPLAYSQGFSPHPRLSLAAPLMVGVTSEDELLEVFLSRPVAPPLLQGAISAQLPKGLRVLEVIPVHIAAPALPALVRWAEYRVEAPTDKPPAELDAAIRGLLSARSLPWKHSRDTGEHAYDLRPLVSSITVSDWQDNRAILHMRLRCDGSGSGRPEQVTAALGLPHPISIHRTRLLLDTAQ